MIEGSTLIEKRLPPGAAPFAAIELLPSLRTLIVSRLSTSVVYGRRQRFDHSPR